MPGCLPIVGSTLERCVGFPLTLIDVDRALSPRSRALFLSHERMASGPDAKWFLIDCSKSVWLWGSKTLLTAVELVFTELAKRRLDLKAYRQTEIASRSARDFFDALGGARPPEADRDAIRQHAGKRPVS